MLQELLSKKEFPADVEGSRRLIEEHTQLKKKVGALLSGHSDTKSGNIYRNNVKSFLMMSSSPVGAEGSSGGVGPGGPEAAAVYPIK